MSDVSETRGILASTAVMASGTVVSRMSGYVRNLLLAAAIGNELHADLFNIANTIPNMLYILLAGGVVQRRARAAAGADDARTTRTAGRPTPTAIDHAGPDLPRRGDVLLVIAAPLVMRLFLEQRPTTAPT